MRDVIAKLKDRIEAETLKSKEYGGKIKTALEQLQEECSAHDDTKVNPSNFPPKANRKQTVFACGTHVSNAVLFSPHECRRRRFFLMRGQALAAEKIGELEQQYAKAIAQLKHQVLFVCSFW